MDRAQFLRALAALAAGSIIGCGSEDDESSSGTGTTTTTSTGSSTTTTSGAGGGGGGGPGAGGGSAATCSVDIDAQITCRHNHSLIITAADLAASVDKTYDIRGTSTTHGHDVTVTAAMFAELKMGLEVVIQVPSSIQSHTIYIKCAGNVPNARDNEACN